MTNDTHKGITDAQMAELKLASGGQALYLIESEIDGDTYQVVVREPGAEYEAWRDARDQEDATPKSKRIADQNFVTRCLVFPTPEEWNALCGTKRGLASTFAGELAEVSGISRSARRKKF